MRDHESYIVSATPKGQSRPTTYWPLVSLLRTADQLTDAEIQWCQDNVEAVRGLIARTSKT